MSLWSVEQGTGDWNLCSCKQRFSFNCVIAKQVPLHCHTSSHLDEIAEN